MVWAGSSQADVYVHPGDYGELGILQMEKNMNPEIIITAVLATITSLAASGTVFILAWRKSQPEIKKIDADTGASKADASESWAQSNQMAVQQMIQFQQQLSTERCQRIEADKKIAELEIKLDQQERRIKRLEAQLTSLGVEPVK